MKSRQLTITPTLLFIFFSVTLAFGQINTASVDSMLEIYRENENNR